MKDNQGQYRLYTIADTWRDQWSSALEIGEQNAFNFYNDEEPYEIEYIIIHSSMEEIKTIESEDGNDTD